MLAFQLFLSLGPHVMNITNKGIFMDKVTEGSLIKKLGVTKLVCKRPISANSLPVVGDNTRLLFQRCARPINCVCSILSFVIEINKL